MNEALDQPSEPTYLAPEQFELMNGFLTHGEATGSYEQTYESYMERVKVLSETEGVDPVAGEIALTGAMLGVLSKDPTAPPDTADRLHQRIVELAHLSEEDAERFKLIHQGFLHRPSDDAYIGARLIDILGYMKNGEKQGADLSAMRIAVLSCAFAASPDFRQKRRIKTFLFYRDDGAGDGAA